MENTFAGVKMDNIFQNVLLILFGLIAIKAMIIGSEFSFYWFLKDKKKYLEWYANREKYKGGKDE